MKKITIGRGRECNIRISDSSDKVSRRQAVITFSPGGKMLIYDTSANGTFVNGERVEKPNGKPIKRGDNVNFAHTVDLDWSAVKNPYRRTIISWVIIILILGALAAGWFIWGDQLLNPPTPVEQTQEKEEPQPTVVVPVDEDVVLEIPEETPTPRAVTTPKGKQQTTPPAKETVNESKSDGPDDSFGDFNGGGSIGLDDK